MLLGVPEDETVKKALDCLTIELQDRGIELESGDDSELPFALQEQKALIEGMLRAWARKRLPYFLQKYEVLFVEKEIEVPLSPDLIFMARPDAILREKATQDIYVLSFKTTGQWDTRKEADAEFDMQGLSENWATEQSGLLAPGEIVTGVLMEYLLVGKREESPKGSGNYITGSFLIHPWLKEGVTPETDEWAAKFYYDCKDPHPMTSRGKPTRCPGGKTHRLGDGFKRINVWERMTMKEYIDVLEKETGDPLLDLFISQTHFRHKEDIEDWYEQILEQEKKIAAHALDINTLATDGCKTPVESARKLLNKWFPQHRASCAYPTKCPMQELCWGALRNDTSPETSGMYVWRKPHHEGEVKQQKGGTE